MIMSYVSLHIVKDNIKLYISAALRQGGVHFNDDSMDVSSLLAVMDIFTSCCQEGTCLVALS